ncbi:MULTISPECIES: LacI family DNA-binding transcriptional regulator [Microbacterium]|uniref:LacI family DNA-binding transcriptional regulator n=1 Tax=Microbacterium TaxID=33882 RepID=UPI00278A6177|nr:MULTISPECIES: LacI family DNA-binding transcriptional regulator [Microbacterium]MDQ1074938.1 DNA-binding LacI/PurR family transcriptional regulator [Microbacterium sp. SORGH_AS_0969]MDQ1115164.1 DNA-binding LacI/PurR family transcriptional regulator [Microbacterium testaceum]
MSTRRATISDVARAAGVSASTASVVFSGKTPTSEATRARVLAAAAELGYTGPDPRAASLRRGRSGIVGVVFDEHLGTAFLDPVTTHMMDGLADGVSRLGAALLLLRDDGETVSEPSLHTAPIDAAVLIGCSPRMRDSLEIVRARGIPVVVIEGDAGEGIPRVLLDNVEAQREAARHLADLGHRDVVIVTLPTDAARQRRWIADDAEVRVDVTADRLAGAREIFPGARALAAAGSSIDEGMIAGRTIFADPGSRPTAVIAQSDLLAAGIIRAAEEAGLRVPHDISVTGFDGVVVDGLAPHVLTTLVQPATAKGRAAGEAVAAMLQDEPPSGLDLACTFRAGTTTAPPRTT